MMHYLFIFIVVSSIVAAFLYNYLNISAKSKSVRSQLHLSESDLIPIEYHMVDPNEENDMLLVHAEMYVANDFILIVPEKYDSLSTLMADEMPIMFTLNPFRYRKVTGIQNIVSLFTVSSPTPTSIVIELSLLKEENENKKVEIEIKDPSRIDSIQNMLRISGKSNESGSIKTSP